VAGVNDKDSESTFYKLGYGKAEGSEGSGRNIQQVIFEILISGVLPKKVDPLNKRSQSA